MSKDIKFIIGKLKEGLEQEKDIVEVVKEKQCATYEVEIGKYKGNIKIQKANNCWLCEEIKKGCYRMENSNKTLKLEMYKEQNSGDYIIQANGEDVLQQEINYCPICRKKIRGGKPMLRIKCKHKREESRNEEIGGYNIPDGCTTEYDIYCKDCGEYLGHWAYGNTDLEYFLKTAGVFEKLKFYIKDKISLRKYKKQIKGLDENSSLPF